MTEAQLIHAAETMRAEGINSDDWIIYGLKHGLLPASFTDSLADTYELGCPNCRNAALIKIGEDHWGD